MSFRTISDAYSDAPDYEIWKCDTCGHETVLNGVGGDVAECPVCISREYEEEARLQDEADELEYQEDCRRQEMSRRGN